MVAWKPLSLLFFLSLDVIHDLELIRPAWLLKNPVGLKRKALELPGFGGGSHTNRQLSWKRPAALRC